jgi:hypothetical protein
MAMRRVGGGQTRTMLYGYLMAHGMFVTRGAIAYGRQKGEVKDGVGWTPEFMRFSVSRANPGKPFL